jgi:hypothetical protein
MSYLFSYFNGWQVYVDTLLRLRVTWSLQSSVADLEPDTEDLYVFEPPGSGSGPLERGTDPDPAPDPSVIKQK